MIGTTYAMITIPGTRITFKIQALYWKLLEVITEEQSFWMAWWQDDQISSQFQMAMDGLETFTSPTASE